MPHLVATPYESHLVLLDIFLCFGPAGSEDEALSIRKKEGTSIVSQLECQLNSPLNWRSPTSEKKTNSNWVGLENDRIETGIL